ncbi:hypothetical protein AOLI_G00323810 [Acnodon oligacanthus]
MKDSSSGNYACQGLGAFCCVFSDEQMPQGSEEVFVETLVYRGTEEDEATLERESVMGVFEEDAVDNDAIPLDLSDGVDVSEEESDFEPEEPGSLIHSLCNWALTFGVSLIAPTARLGLLRFCHPDLPKDARTLLRTKTDLSIQKRCGGLYYYFGFLSSIKNMLSQATESIVDGFTLKLQAQFARTQLPPKLPIMTLIYTSSDGLIRHQTENRNSVSEAHSQTQTESWKFQKLCCPSEVELVWMRMKILLIFIFCLMSVGDGASREVTGYSGGGILLTCKYLKESEPKSLYFCRSSGSDCDELMKTEAEDKWRNRGRFSLFNNSTAAVFQVLITELTVEDAGRYQCGADKDSSTSVDLNVQKDLPFEKSISVIGHAGGGVDISCKYPQSHRTPSFSRKRHRTQNPPLSPSQSAQGSSNSHAIKDSRRLSDSSTVDSAAQLPSNPSEPPQTDYDNVQLPTNPCDSSHPLYATQTPSVSPDQSIYSTAQLPTVLSDSSAGDTQLSSGKSAEGPTHAALTFSKTAASSADAATAGAFKKEEDPCDHATVNHGMWLA